MVRESSIFNPGGISGKQMHVRAQNRGKIDLSLSQNQTEANKKNDFHKVTPKIRPTVLFGADLKLPRRNLETERQVTALSKRQ